MEDNHSLFIIRYLKKKEFLFINKFIFRTVLYTKCMDSHKTKNKNAKSVGVKNIYICIWISWLYELSRHYLIYTSSHYVFISKFYDNNIEIILRVFLISDFWLFYYYNYYD